MTAQRGSKASWSVRFIIGMLVAAGSYWGWGYWRKHVIEENEQNARACLKALTVAETDFRSNDRDGNFANDFWTGDVASLYSLVPPRGPSDPIVLIEKALADADGARSGAKPFCGYLFRVLQLDENGNPYREDKTGRNPSKFGFCAYPAAYGRTGRWTYIVNEGNTVFAMDTKGTPVLRYPSDPPLKGVHAD